MFVGEDGIGLSFDDAQLAQNLGTAALGIILVEGGLTTRFSDVRKVLAPAGVLATVGVGVSAVVTATCVHLLLGVDWQLALLLGAIVSSTDAAAVFSVLRVVPLPRRLGGLLEAESGFNDAPAVILVLLFSAVPLELDPIRIAATLVYQLGTGIVIGLTCGFLGAMLLRRIARRVREVAAQREARDSETGGDAEGDGAGGGWCGTRRMGRRRCWRIRLKANS